MRTQPEGLLDPRPKDYEVARRRSHQRRGVPSLLYALPRAVILLVVLVGIGLLMTRFSEGDVVGKADAFVAHWMVRQRTPLLNDISTYTTYLGETITVVSLGLLAVVAVRVVSKRWRDALLVIVGLVGEVTIFVVTALIVQRDRPHVHHLDNAPPTSSYPSGHTAATVVLYGALVILTSEHARSAFVRWFFRLLAVAVPVIVAVSRLYQGMHHLTDVLAGIALGLVWLAMAVRTVRIGSAHTEPATAGPGRTDMSEAHRVQV